MNHITQMLENSKELAISLIKFESVAKTTLSTLDESSSFNTQ